jgi:hypothetical protein
MSLYEIGRFRQQSSERERARAREIQDCNILSMNWKIYATQDHSITIYVKFAGIVETMFICIIPVFIHSVKFHIYRISETVYFSPTSFNKGFDRFIIFEQLIVFVSSILP